MISINITGSVILLDIGIWLKDSEYSVRSKNGVFPFALNASSEGMSNARCNKQFSEMTRTRYPRGVRFNVPLVYGAFPIKKKKPQSCIFRVCV